MKPISQRAPFGWPVHRIDPAGSLVLSGLRLNDREQSGYLRVTVSVDDREEKIVSAYLCESGTHLGDMDLRFAHSLEPFQLRLAAPAFEAAAREGVLLKLSKATTPLWLLADELPVGAEALSPQLIADSDRDSSVFFDRLASLASVQPFGWMEGCVLDGLLDLHVASGNGRWLETMRQHLALFIDQNDQLVYEDPKGFPCDGRLRSIEATLPFAPLAKVAPDHPLLSLALDFFRSKLADDGTFAKPEMVTAEGSYTMAYPLAVISRIRRDNALAQMAAGVLRVRRVSLWQPEGLWLRHHVDGGRSFRSWARGVAWYLMGLVRSIEHLEGVIESDDLKTDFKEVATWAAGLQRNEGLWGCYLDDPAVSIDTSGSAGIAAALARGAQLGLLPFAYLEKSRACWQGLLKFLTPDGFLGGAAQSNRGGESLQRSDYRVISPMGMGLMGQLAAALFYERNAS